jgi:hypothetical protein
MLSDEHKATAIEALKEAIARAEKLASPWSEGSEPYKRNMRDALRFEKALAALESHTEYEPVIFDPDGDIYQQEVAKKLKEINETTWFFGIVGDLVLCRVKEKVAR